MSLYPDNANRHTRAIQLLSQCAEFQVRITNAKNDLEECAKAANDAIYEAYVKIEPSTPPRHDWEKEIKLTEQVVETGKDISWGIKAGSLVTMLCVGHVVKQALTPMLEASNMFAEMVAQVNAADAAAQAAARLAAEQAGLELSEAEAVQAGEKAAADVATRLIPEALEAGAVEATEVTVSLGTRAVVGLMRWGPGLAAGAAAAAIVTVLFEVYNAETERTKLRDAIHKGFKARLQYKLLVMKYEQLKEELYACVNAFKVVTDPALFGDMTKERLDQVANGIVNQHNSKVAAITEDVARKALEQIDNVDGAYTREDHFLDGDSA